jgi:predicted phosphodiesterase
MKERMKPGKWKILEWTCRQIDGDARRFLSSLPTLHRETLAGRFELLMVHGSPVSAEDTIYPSITPYGLKKKLAGTRVDILVCGHTHIPFVRRVAGILVVNRTAGRRRSATGVRTREDTARKAADSKDHPFRLSEGGAPPGD